MKKTSLPHRRQIFKFRLTGYLILMLLLGNPGPVLAVALAVIKPEGNGIYTIELQNCVMLREVQLTVDYPLSLGTPRVSPRTIAISNTVNVSSGPSMVSLDLIAKREFLPSGGTLLALLFPDQLGDPVPVGISGWATDINGSRQVLHTWYQGPNDKPKLAESDNTDEEQASDSGSAAGSTAPATTAAADAAREPSGSGEGDRLKAAAIPAGSDKAIPRSADHPLMPVPSQMPDIARTLPRGNDPLGKLLPPVEAFQSVLDRFRLFAGKRTEAELRHLFDPDPAAPFRQAPAVAMADGRTAVTVTFNLAFPGQEVNVMVLTNIRMISFRYLNDGTMAEMVVLPEAGKCRSSLMIKAGERIFDLPLTVAPPLDPAMATIGASSGEIIRSDYNDDGVADYQDDYILMANRLALFQ